MCQSPVWVLAEGLDAQAFRDSMRANGSTLNENVNARGQPVGITDLQHKVDAIKLIKALRHGGAGYVDIVAFGTKTPMQFFAEHIVPLARGPMLLDIGTNVATRRADGIPLLSLERPWREGRVETFCMCATRVGSLKASMQNNMKIKIYPSFVHLIKRKWTSRVGRG